MSHSAADGGSAALALVVTRHTGPSLVALSPHVIEIAGVAVRPRFPHRGQDQIRITMKLALAGPITVAKGPRRA